MIPDDSFERMSRYRLDLVEVQEVRRDRGGTEPAGEYTFFYGKRNENNELNIVFLYKGIISTAKRVEFISDTMLYIILRCCWCNIIVLKVHAQTKDKIDDVKDRFYRELEHVSHKFPKCHMKILLGDFFVKIGREDVFKPTVEN
jgi:hypothetical protein